MEVSRQPPNPSLLTRARHSHHIIIRPAVEFGQRDILLAQQSRYLRAMISRMVDGLDQDEDGWDIIELSIIGKFKYLARIELFRDRDQPFTALTSPSAQFFEAWKGVMRMQRRLRPPASESLHIAFFTGEDMHQGLAYTAKGSSHGRV